MSGAAAEVVVPAALETPAVEAPAPSGADPAAPATGATAAEPAKVDPDAQALDAFKEGAGLIEPKPDAQGRVRDPATGKFIEKPAASAVDPAKGPTGATPAAGATGASGATASAEPEKDPVKLAAAKVETEIQSLGLKEKAAERFRELAKRPTPEAFAQVQADAQRGSQWEDIILQSTVKPDQLNRLLGYGQAINSGDPVLMGKAYDAMQQEMAWLGKQLGREAPGVDPLTEHPDLAKEVAEGDITRARALELAATRAAGKLTTQHQQTTQRQQQEQQQLEREKSTAMDALGAEGARLKASDPHFATKIAMLKPTFDIIMERMPPSQWVDAVRAAYLKVPTPAPAPAAAPPKPGPMPIRPTGSSAAQVPVLTDELAAFKAGASSVS